jgi:histidyl-tRNA synthetase
MGDVVLGELIREHGGARDQMETAVRSDPPIEIYAVIAKEERRGDALRQIQELRDRGYRIDFPLTPLKVPKQFQAAEQAGARIVLLFGNEWPNVAVKNLASGEQQLVTKENLLTHLESALK